MSIIAGLSRELLLEVASKVYIDIENLYSGILGLLKPSKNKPTSSKSKFPSNNRHVTKGSDRTLLSRLYVLLEQVLAGTSLSAKGSSNENLD